MNISICKARISDVGDILKLQNKIWKNEGGSSNMYDMCDWVRYGHVFVAKQKGNIIGSIAAFRTSKNEVFVTEWIIDKRYRNKGIGSRLYRRLINATHLPILSIVSPYYKESVALHFRLGFSAVRRLENPYGLTEKKERLLMRRIYKQNESRK